MRKRNRSTATRPRRKSLGGSSAAEHGLGKRRAKFLALQYTPEQIESMKAVKRRLDPDWRLGRGTLFEQNGVRPQY
ncbi:MAG: FAD-linked oxidase C-terminal domain-containing protein [Bryobacteraceae bacterium]